MDVEIYTVGNLVIDKVYPIREEDVTLENNNESLLSFTFEILY